MKKVLSVLAFALVLIVAATARSQSNNIIPTGTETNAKARETDTRPNNPNDTTSNATGQPITGSTASANSAVITPASADGTAVVPNASTSPEESARKAEAANPALTDVYRVGVGDVLDIRLLNVATRESRLFSVMAGGLLEYPLAGEPFQVAGLTTDEIDQRLTSKVKLFENPQIVVSVREFTSHTAIVSGLVNDPGTKVLRREAMPLYVVLAEAQLKPEAGRAMIVRADGQTVIVSLSDDKATTTLVLPGDVITLTVTPPAPPQFFYIGGQVNAPGQKDFHAGLTLTQAVLASGGATRFARGKVRVSRQGADGRLVSTEYNLKQIESGKIPDPELQSGDRIEVGRGSW